MSVYDYKRSGFIHWCSYCTDDTNEWDTIGVYEYLFQFIFVHGVGAIALLALTLAIKEKANSKSNIPLYYYSGGALGALIIVLNNITFVKLGVSVTVALVFLGQLIASVIIDTFGLINMKKIPFVKEKVIGFTLITFGIIITMMA